LAFQRLSEYDDFLDAAHTHSIIGASYLALEVGAVVSLLAVLAGGVPLAFSALPPALGGQRSDVLLLLGVPVLAFLGLMMYGYIGIQVVAGASPPNRVATPEGKALFLGLIAVLILGAVASSWAVPAAISRSEINAHWYRFARIPALVTALAMVVMCAATIAWGLALQADKPQLFNGEDGIVATSTALSWLVIAVVMMLATLAALTALFRGLLPSERVEAPAATPAQA